MRLRRFSLQFEETERYSGIIALHCLIEFLAGQIAADQYGSCCKARCGFSTSFASQGPKLSAIEPPGICRVCL